jgi:hypothetical protein
MLMLLTKIIFTAWLSLVQVASSAGTVAPAAGSIVRIEVDGKRSNLERIPVRIHVVEKDLNVQGIQVVSGNAPASDSSPTIRVRAFDAKTKAPLPITMIKTGEGRDHDEKYVALAMVVPVSDEERDEAVRDYLARLTQEAKTGDAHVAQVYASKNGQTTMANTLKGLYLQNRVGRVILRVEYSSMHPGQKIVHAEAEQKVIEIEYKGEFFNQAGFKK